MSATLFLIEPNPLKKKLHWYFIAAATLSVGVGFIILNQNIVEKYYSFIFFGILFLLLVTYLGVYNSMKPFKKSSNKKILINNNQVIIQSDENITLTKTDIKTLKVSLIDFYLPGMSAGVLYHKFLGNKNIFECSDDKNSYKYHFYIESRKEFLRLNNSLIKLKQSGIITELNISSILKDKKYN